MSGNDTEYERCNTEPCLDCESPISKVGSTIASSPWTIGQCLNDPSSLCILPKKDSDRTCPCCPPLVLKNGRCTSRDD
uniref:Uncharacterized protein n=1 Tax=Romanomermis culicivorax TaxID=13658 RepID=A0A915IS66_ROMCU